MSIYQQFLRKIYSKNGYLILNSQIGHGGINFSDYNNFNEWLNYLKQIQINKSELRIP